MRNYMELILRVDDLCKRKGTLREFVFKISLNMLPAAFARSLLADPKYPNTVKNGQQK